MGGGSEPGWEASQLTSTARPFGPGSIVMPRQRSNATDEKDVRVTAAVNEYLEKKYKSITNAAKAFNAPVSTVKHRVRGRQTHVQSHEQQQILTTAEEDELVRWITQLTMISYAPGKVGNEPNEPNIRGSLLVSSRTNQHFFARSPQRAERRPDGARSLGERAARLARSARSWDIW